jgi:hypothetical protein
MNRPEAERARAFLELRRRRPRRGTRHGGSRRGPRRDRRLPRTAGRRQAARSRSRVHGIDFPRSHSIRFLLDLLYDRGLAPPSDLHGIVVLYPFGVQLRYEAPLDEEPLDRAAMRELLERLRAWTTAHVS